MCNAECLKDVKSGWGMRCGMGMSHEAAMIEAKWRRSDVKASDRVG